MRQVCGIVMVCALFFAVGATVVAQDVTEDCEIATGAAEADDETGEVFTAHVILPNMRGDRSFVDAAAAGGERALAEPGIEGVIVETAGPPEHDAAMRRAVREAPGVVVSVTVDSSIVGELAAEFPEQLFAAHDTFFMEAPGYENLSVLNIATHENSYLAGIVAGMMTESGRVGAVGGGDFPGINQFIVGYEEGVLAVCPDCEVVISYVGGPNAFRDPLRAKEIALGQYDSGVDIIYQVAALSGEGVFEAAEETENFAIGVDSNQDDLYPGVIIVSAMKRVDNAVYDLVQTAASGDFAPGIRNAGMAEGYAGLSWDDGVCSRTFDEFGPEDMVEKLPEVREAVEAAREGILAGEVTVTNVLAPPAGE